MTIGLPESAKEVEDRIKVDVAREAPDSNPYVQNSWLLALVVGYGRRIFDFYRDLKRSEENTFPDTAVGDRAEQWATIYGKTRIAGTRSTGNVVAIGTATTLIPSGTALTAGDLNYTSTANATIAAAIISVASITRTGTTATATTTNNHNLASNVPVTIAGATQTEYNVSGTSITVTGLNTFTYQITGTPVNATGTITAAFTAGTVPVISTEFGVQTNQSLDTPLTLQSPIAGVTDEMNVDFSELIGGSDQETDAKLRARYLERIRNPIAHFSVSDIVSKAKEVVGVTRVFVQGAGTTTGNFNITSINRAGQVATVVSATAHNLQNHMQVTITGATQTEYNVVDARVLVVSTTTFVYLVTGTPATPATGGPVATSSIPLGVTQVYFTRDNDASNIPSAAQVNTVKTKLAEIRPANTSDNSLIVSAPIAVPVAFTFTAVLPNTATMKAAISANLSQFFEENTVVGSDITLDAYRAAINNTVDTLTGDTVESFTLSTPTANIAIIASELGTLGTITI